MKKSIVGLMSAMAMGAMAATGPFGGENIIVNGSFETGTSMSGNVGYANSASTSAWTIGGASGLSMPGSWCTHAAMHFPDGNHCAFIQGVDENGSFISQTFTAPQAGVYRLSFYHCARPNTVLGMRTRVLVDDRDYGYATNWSMDFELSTFDIPLSVGQHTLKFKNDANGLTGDMSVVIDAVAMEIPVEPGLTLGNLDNYGFRFDFSNGSRVISGARYTEQSTMNFASADGPNGLATAAKCTSGWGTIVDGDKSLNGDWSVAMSCMSTTGAKQVIVSVGGNGTIDRKQLLICTETDGRMYFAIGQRWSNSGRNVPSSVTVGGLLDPETRFHSFCCVHRKDSNIICCYVDGMLAGRLNAIYQCDSRAFMAGLQFNHCHGGLVSGVSDGPGVPMQDFRFYERALTDAEVAMYAKAYPARRPSQSPVATDVNPTADTTYETDPTAGGVLLVPDGVTVTAPSLAGGYFNYGKIVLTGGDEITAAPRGPGVMRFTGTQTLNYTSLGNSPVEIAGNVTIAASSPVTYRSSTMTIESGTVTLAGQANLGDAADSDYWDPYGSTLNFLGGTFAGSGYLYMGGRKTQNDINITSGTFTARVAPWGATDSQGANRRVNVGGTGVFAPPSLAYVGSTAPGSVQRMTIRLMDGGTFTPSADWPAYAWLDVLSGDPTIELAADVAPAAQVVVERGANLVVSGAKTLDLRSASIALEGSCMVTNGATMALSAYNVIGGAFVVAEDAKLVLDLAEYDGRQVLLTAAGGIRLDGGVEGLVGFVNAPAGYHPALGEDGTTIRVTVDDLTVPVTAEWTGGGEAGNLTDPANWNCWNANGVLLEGAIPRSMTYARIVGNTNFQLPYDAAAMLAAMDSATAEDRMTTICAHIKYLQRGETADFSYMDIPYASYNPLGEVPLTKLREDAFKNRYLGQSQLRFDGWFKVTPEQAGEWALEQRFDDYYAMYFDGECVLKNKTYTYNETGSCTMTAGWHRFTLIVGDTYGGFGLTKSVGGVPTVLGVRINGGAEVAFEEAFQLGTGPSRMWKQLVAADCTLAEDCDWTGVTGLQDGAVIDLHGHSLKLSALQGAAEITDSVGDGELHGDFKGLVNTEVAFTGKLRFVKEGPGGFWASKAGQSYTGGTEILEGEVYFGTAAQPLGPKNSEIKIGAGATLDMNGQLMIYNYDTAGTIRMSTGTGSNGYNAGWRCFGPEFKLSGDAKVTGKFFYFGCPDQNPMYFTMNGHTLTFEMDDYIGIGSWRARDWGVMKFTKGLFEWLVGYGPIGVDLEVHSPAQFKLGGNFDMNGFWYDSTDWQKNNGVQAHLLVYGVWKATAYRPPVCLFNNSTIDLNLLSEPLEIAGGDRTCAAGEIGYVNFSMGESGTCFIDVSERRVRSNGEKVINWTAVPAATTFELTENSQKLGYWMVVRDDGLYVGRTGMAILIR